MDMNLVREIVTVLSFAAFVGVIAYAAHPRNRRRFDEAAQIPFDKDDPLPSPLPRERGQS